METQVFADGVDFENSIPYHRLTLEMLVAAYVLSSKTGDPLSPSFRERLFGMFDYVDAYTRPDGRAPLVGDSDDGRLHVLADYFGWIPDDHRYLLAVGSAIFDQPQWRRVAAQSPTALEELAWLCGPAAVAAYATGQRAASEPTPRAFAPSGHYVLAAPEYHAVVSADPVGTGGLGNHKHNDIFSYELSVHGVPVIVDRGSFRYLSDERARAYFRSTRSHSTVMVQGAEQNALTGTFGMRPDADVNVAQWVTAERETLFDARHTGYMRLERPVVHRRIIYASTGPFGWVVLDVLEGSGEHTIESHIHFHPDGKLTLKEFPVQPSADALLASAQEHAPGVLHSAPRLTPVAQYRQCNVTVRVLSFNTRVAEAREAQHSPRFGQAVSAPVLHLHAEVSAGTAFGYVIQGSVAE